VLVLERCCLRERRVNPIRSAFPELHPRSGSKALVRPNPSLTMELEAAFVRLPSIAGLKMLNRQPPKRFSKKSENSKSATP